MLGKILYLFNVFFRKWSLVYESDELELMVPPVSSQRFVDHTRPTLILTYKRLQN